MLAKEDAEDSAVVDMCLQVGGATSSDILFAALLAHQLLLRFNRSGTAVATFMSSIARVGELHANMKTSKSSTSTILVSLQNYSFCWKKMTTTLMAAAITKESSWSQVEAGVVMHVCESGI